VKSALAVAWFAICHVSGCTLSPTKLGELPGPAGAGGAGGTGGTGGTVPDGIACGTTSCDPSAEVCCTNAANTMDKVCAGSCPANSYARRCDGPEDCGGAPCCAGVVSSDSPWIASCGVGTMCAPIQHCHSTADCPTSRPYCCPTTAVDIPACSPTQVAGCT
jgi:hypothetical protein